MGIGVALVLDQSQLTDPPIGLAQAHTEGRMYRHCRMGKRLSIATADELFW
jgi:hypothetical protein